LSIAQPRLNVKLVASHGGISVGEDGFSHHAIEDLSLMGALPGFTIIVPADAIETARAVRAAAENHGPFYIRLCRPKTPFIYSDGYRFNLGRAVTMREGTDACVIAIGLMVSAALEAAERLASESIECRVLNMPTIKPLDEAAIADAAAETGAIVVAEEHLEHGGLGSAVARVIAKRRPVPAEFVAIKDTYAKSGKPEELLQQYGLTAEDIEQAVHRVVERKRH
jgi:transketolase